MRRALAIAGIVTLLLSAHAAFALPEPTVQGFINRLYETYSNDKPQLPEKQVYSKALLKLMARDGKLAGTGVGYLNGDPLCDCQDYESFRADISVTEKLDEATAKIDFTNFGREVHLDLNLVRENGQWRVDDVITSGDSLQEALRKSIAAAKKKL